MNRNYNYYQNIKENLQRQLVDLASILEWLDTPDSANELEAIIIEETPDLPPQTRLELINSTIADRIDDTHRQMEDINAKLMTIHTIHTTWADGRTHIPDRRPTRPLRRRPTRPLRRIPIPPPPVTQPDLVIDISDDGNSPPPPMGSPPSTPPHYLPSSPINSPPGSPPRRGGIGASGATKVKSRKSKKMQHSRKRTKRSRKNKIR